MLHQEDSSARYHLNPGSIHEKNDEINCIDKI